MPEVPGSDPLDILPFRFLGAASRERLRSQLEPVRWSAGETVIEQGGGDSDVYLLTRGAVLARDPTRKGSDGNRIEAGHYFGERPALFGTPRAVTVVAVEPSAGYRFPGEALLALLPVEPAFAHALTFIVRDKHGMFVAMDRFLAEVQLGASRGHLVIGKLLKHYRRLAPALHRGLHDAALDLGALSYAVRRLPTNVTRTFVWFAADELPDRYVACQELFQETTAPARRRITFEMVPGKSMLTLRDGLSDLLDLVTCLCIYAVEARKLRRRLRTDPMLMALAREDTTVLDEVLAPHERSALDTLWPGQVPRRLLEMSFHHEDITVHTYKRVNNYNSAHAERWIRQVADATRELLGCDPATLPEDFPVHVISSNTHSVTNCLSPWIPENEEALLAWGEANAPSIFGATWHDPNDRLVALVRPYLDANPDQRAAKTARDDEVRIQLDETAFTGIRVQLFRMDRLVGQTLDVSLPQTPCRGLIVNIDYAFGQQAEPILANVVHLFGRRIRSVNVLGKAGGLQGARGDVLVADNFVNQRDDVLLAHPVHVDVDRLAARLPGRTVHRGPILTVLGTVLQNDRLLHYYKHLYGCVGLEMEGSYYCRQVLECRTMHMLPEDVKARFVYYISDLPLAAHTSLSTGMSAWEGIPPLYAITREVLAEVFANPGG